MHDTMEHRRLQRKRPRERAGRALLLLTSFLVGEARQMHHVQQATTTPAFLTGPSASTCGRKNPCTHDRRMQVFAGNNWKDNENAEGAKNKGLEPIVEKLLSPFAVMLAGIGASEEEELRRDIAAAEARLKTKKAEMERVESQARLAGAGFAATLVVGALISFGDSMANVPAETGGVVKTGGAGASAKKGFFRTEKKAKPESRFSFFSAPATVIVSGAIGVVGANILLRSKEDLGEGFAEAQHEFDEALATSRGVDSNTSSNNSISTAT